MLYSPQMGLRVSICEFLKDLISHEVNLNSSQGKLPEMLPARRSMLSDILLNEVVHRLINFLEEETPSDELVKKSLEHSKCLVL